MDPLSTKPDLRKRANKVKESAGITEFDDDDNERETQFVFEEPETDSVDQQQVSEFAVEEEDEDKDKDDTGEQTPVSRFAVQAGGIGEFTDQEFVPGRTQSMADFLANLLGIGIGLVWRCLIRGGSWTVHSDRDLAEAE